MRGDHCSILTRTLHNQDHLDVVLSSVMAQAVKLLNFGQSIHLVKGMIKTQN